MSKRASPAGRAPDSKTINRGLLEFIDASPTPFHAVRSIAAKLDAAGFSQLEEGDSWNLQAGGRYYVERNGSSIVAWQQGAGVPAEHGWRMLGAHTDSPCLKIKPQPDLRVHGVHRLGVEVYGGALLNPWFDRDLSIAGRVHFSKGKAVHSALVDFREPVAVVPSLAIHLDREVNNARSINPQLHLPVLLGTQGSMGERDFRDILLQKLRDELSPKPGKQAEVLDYELCLYDTQPAAVTGFHGDFISAARLDNLLSCYIDTLALIDSTRQNDAWSLLVCNDHEEVGSTSASGAAGPMLAQVLERIEPCSESRARAMARSMFISTDNAHGLHPNYADKMDANHAPLLNAGPVIKVNANQRYASNSETQALFRTTCRKADVPLQSFVVRTDMACGSTIGPITASALGVKTLDIGVPTFAMHSIRELAGSADTGYLYRALRAFYQRES